MAIVKMQKLSVAAHKKNRKAILELLQSMGAMEINTSGIESEGLSKMDTQGARSRFEKNAETFDSALSILKKYAPEKSGGIELLAEKKMVPRSEFNQIVEKRGEILASAQALLRKEKELQECAGTILKDENLLGQLTPWMKLDIPMNVEGTAKTDVLTGTLTGLLDEAQVYAAATKGLPENPAVSVSVLDAENDLTYVTVICLKRDRAQVEENLRSSGFARPGFLTHHTPKKKAELVRKDIEDHRSRIEEAKKSIVGYQDQRETFRIAADYFRSRAEKYRILGTIPQSKSVFFLEGWVPAAKAADVTKLLEEKFDAVVDAEEKRDDEIEPTKLKNNKWSEMVEGVLESYGLPQHGKVDPTFLMSIFYVFFFGMMLSDAGYGFFMMIVCGIILAKYKRLSKGMHDMIQLFFWCGLSTAFWGIMYGGFFGNMIDTTAQTFFGRSASAPSIIQPLWFEPMANPMKLLVYCMLFGLIHLLTGLGIKGYEYLKDGDVVGFISDILSWYLFILGLVFILLPTSLFEGISQMKFNFPSWMHTFSLAITIIGALLILVMQERSRKNWVLRILLGAYDLYGITSWLSDVLSYSRLLALGLATGVIANVINMMAGMVGAIGGPVGVILYVVILIFGHTLNFLINLLGAYVHTNRLQYVEFFGKFYDAGGVPFKPFTTNNKYIEIKEEH